jgi:hypothetical protein
MCWRVSICDSIKNICMNTTKNPHSFAHTWECVCAYDYLLEFRPKNIFIEICTKWLVKKINLPEMNETKKFCSWIKKILYYFFGYHTLTHTHSRVPEHVQKKRWKMDISSIIEGTVKFRDGKKVLSIIFFPSFLFFHFSTVCCSSSTPSNFPFSCFMGCKKWLLDRKKSFYYHFLFAFLGVLFFSSTYWV